MTATSRWIYAVTFILVACGFLLPFWPLVVIGVLLAALSGRWLFAIGVAVLVDVAWGGPTGAFAFIIFPFTALALVATAVRLVGGKYFVDRSLPERL